MLRSWEVPFEGAHALSLAILLQETERHGVTPVQHGALQSVGDTPGIDQRRLARSIGSDTSTIAGGVTCRAEAAQEASVR